MDNFNYDQFNQYLKEKIIFFYTSHSNNLPKEIFLESDHIKYINNNENPLFDINLLMMEVDIASQ